MSCKPHYVFDTNVILEGTMKTLSLKLPDALVAKLSILAEKRGSSKSNLVREAVESFLAATNGLSEVSCYALATDVWGSLDGPGDLSFNKKHMEGYGQ
jgi:predicted DNA-binding protein